EVEVLVHVDILVGAEIVGHETESATHAIGNFGNRKPIDQGIATRRLVERGEDAHAGRLPRPVRSDVTEHLTRIDRERHVVHGMRIAKKAVDVPQLDLWIVAGDCHENAYHSPWTMCTLASSLAPSRPSDVPSDVKPTTR